MMRLYPAIDLRDGRAVRLRRGDYGDETVYSDDPLAVARSYEAAGARWIHVVDLDAARTGEPAQLGLVSAIAGAVSCSVQAGGGVRSVGAAGRLIDAGVARVVVGTAAVEHPELVGELTARFPGRVAVGLDAHGRDLAVRGWTEATGVDLTEVARRLEGSGVSAVVVTEIGRDGTLAGPDLDQLAAVLAVTGLDVIASGGVGDLDDLRALAALAVPAAGAGASPRRLAGVIVGKALYEGRFSVGEALSCLAPV